MFGSFIIETNAAFNPEINYQGKLVNPTTNIEVPDGAYDFVFKLYTVAGGGSAIWTESWTNLWTETNITFTNDGCAAGIDKVAYTTETNEGTLSAGQYLWNATKKESSVIESVDTANNWICVYDTPSTWENGDEVTNRIYIKSGLFSVMLGTITSLSSIDFNQTLYLGIKVGADNEMKPRKVLGAIPAAFEAGKLDGIDSTSFLRSDAADTMSASEAGTLLTVTQSGTGDIVNLTGNSITTGDALEITGTGLTTGNLVKLSPTINAGDSQVGYGMNLLLTDSTSGTGGYSAMFINTAGSGTGSGSKYLIQAQSGSADKFLVNTSGNILTAAGQGLDVASAGELKLGDATATTVSVGTTAATTLNIGAGGALTRLINIGTGTGADTINIGTGGTGADDIDIGDAAADVAITEADWSIAGTGAATFASLDVSSGGITNAGAISGATTINASGDLTIYEATNDANPEIRIGSADAEEGHIQAVYDSGTQTLDYLLISTDSTTEGDIVLNPNGNVGIGTTSPDQLFHLEKLSALTSTVQQIARLTHITSGTPAAGIGLGIEFEQETSADNNEIIAAIEAITTDVTATEEDGAIVFKTMNSGAAAAERLRIANDGTIVINNDSWLSATNNAGTGNVNMFKLNSSDEIEVGAALNIGTIEFPEDGGPITAMDMPVSATPADGAEMGYTFKVDGENILTIYSEADSAGGVDNLSVYLKNDSPPDLILDNSTTGADADSGYLVWRGNDGAADTELDMSIFLDVTSTTDYKLSIMDDGKANEVASIDQSGNLWISGGLAIGDATSHSGSFTSFTAAETKTANITGLLSNNPVVRKVKLYISNDCDDTGPADTNINFRLSFYNSDSMTEDELIKDFYFNLTYTELGVATADGNTSIRVDCESGFLKYDQVKFLGVSGDIERITALPGTGYVTAAVFTDGGGGDPNLDDCTSGGTFTADTYLDYRVQIDGEGSPDTFKWSDDGGSTWDATAVAITGGAQSLNNGVTVTFGATTGHDLNDYWDFTGMPVLTTTAVSGVNAVDTGVVKVVEFTDLFQLYDADKTNEIHAKLETFSAPTASMDVAIEIETQ